MNAPATVRRLDATDRADILEISRHIWEGHDYLPFVIDDWLKDPKSFVYGVEADGHLVAVANLRIVDEGRTGFMEGLRVHPEYRRRGFGDTLTKLLVEMGEDLNLERLRYTTSNRNDVSLKLAKKYGLARVLEMGFFWHPIPNAAPSMEQLPRIRESTPKEARRIVQSHPQIAAYGLLFYDWKVLDCTLEGFETVGKTHRFYTTAEDSERSSLSYACARRMPGPLSWALTIYAIRPQDFIAHLSYNAAEALKNSCGSIMVTYDLKFEDTLNEAKWIPQERSGTHMVLVEKALHAGKN